MMPLQIQEVNADFVPDLKEPELVINIDVLQKVCCVSLLPHFARFKKYNPEQFNVGPNVEVRKKCIHFRDSVRQTEAVTLMSLEGQIGEFRSEVLLEEKNIYMYIFFSVFFNIIFHLYICLIVMTWFVGKERWEKWRGACWEGWRGEGEERQSREADASRETHRRWRRKG